MKTQRAEQDQVNGDKSKQAQTHFNQIRYDLRKNHGLVSGAFSWSIKTPKMIQRFPTQNIYFRLGIQTEFCQENVNVPGISHLFKASFMSMARGNLICSVAKPCFQDALIVNLDKI